MIERQELHCHNCNRYVQFNVDLSLNGNHVLNCPNCGHEHCRVVRNGRITGDRWGQRNGSSNWGTHAASGTSTTATSTWDTIGTGNTFTYQAWSNTTTGT